MLPSLVLSLALPLHAEDAPAAVAARYFAHATGQDPAELELVHEDFLFHDPPSEVFGGSSLRVRGREAFGRMRDGWRIERTWWTPESALVCGDHVVLTGRIAWRSAGGARTPDLDFCVALEVREGKVASRRDFGDWDRIVPGAREGEAALEEKARAWLGAWLAGDAAEVEAFLAEDATLVDPTAEVVGEPVETRGREQVLARLVAEREDVLEVAFREEKAFFTGRHALFAGSLAVTRSAPEGAATATYPVVLQLEFEGDRLVEHRRYADHLAARDATALPRERD